MVRKISIVLLCIALMTIAQAHEFWIHPVKFFLHPGERTEVRFVVGENFIGEPWDLKTHRVEKLDIYHGTGTKNLLDSIKDDPKKNISIALQEEGTHLVVMESDNA